MILAEHNVGIIGQGFVGTAVREKFKSEYNVFTYDKNKASESKVFHSEDISDYEVSKHDIVDNCDIVFVCVPTPMFKNGKCDTSIVESVIQELHEICEKLDKNIITIVKSTIPPGTTLFLNDISKRISVAFSPEFLTEANSIEDFKNQNRIILGIDWIEQTSPIVNLFKRVFPNADILVLQTNEAEMVKYMTNLFLATKVSFFNDMYKLMSELNNDSETKMSYDKVINATLYDKRIGKSHYMVPGPDGDFGFGGHCFPKDMSAILNIADELKITIPTVYGANVTNTLVRKNKDWEKMKGRAVVEESDDLKKSDIKKEDLINEL